MVVGDFGETFICAVEIGATITDISNIGCRADYESGGDSCAHVGVLIQVVLMHSFVGAFWARARKPRRFISLYRAVSGNFGEQEIDDRLNDTTTGFLAV